MPPQGARGDYWDRWGADDLSCFSRYDGLMSFRLTPLGALTFFFDPVEAVASAAPLAAAVSPATSLEEADRALESLGVGTELDLERARAREIDAGAHE